MSGAGMSITLLGVAVAMWPSAEAGQLRLRWLVGNRFRSSADGPEPVRWLGMVGGRDSGVRAGGGRNGSVLIGDAPRRSGAVRRRAAAVVVVAVCALVGAWTQGRLLAALATCVLGAACRVWLGLHADRTRRADRAALSVAIATLLDECAAGAGLAVALRTSATSAGVHRQAFERAAVAAASGGDVAEAWHDEPGLAGLGVACSLATHNGAALGVALAVARDEVQADIAVGSAAAETLAGPMASALLLAPLPVLGLALGVAMGADPLHVLTQTRWGELALALGVVFDLAGVLWVLRLARRAMP